MKKKVMGIGLALCLIWAGPSLGISGNGLDKAELIESTVGNVPGMVDWLDTERVSTGKESGHEKLDSLLSGLVQRFADSRRFDSNDLEIFSISEDRVLVQVTTTVDELDSAKDAVEYYGGEITGVNLKKTVIQCWVPVNAIEDLAMDDSVLFIRRPYRAVLFAGNSETEALDDINASAWHTAGYTGSGVKVGVVDGGFIGYADLKGTDLPASVTVNNFVDGETLGDVDGTTEHGTACAEIVHDMAPDASIYLAKIGTNIDLEEAVTWLKDTIGADIITTSLGWYNVTPGDGTGEFADVVNTAYQAGILWTTAAGNDREAHWGGLFNEDEYGYHLFDTGQNVNYFGPGNGDAYYIDPGYLFSVYVRWDDWTAVDQDFDLLLLRWSGSQWEMIASSENVQDGTPGQTPTEFAYAATTGAATAYGFVISKWSATRNVNFEIFVPKFLRPDEILNARSLANLADAPMAMTVAALDVTSPYPQESYSSEGPANGPGGSETGGAVKPDISGFANVSTESYGAGIFNGTSSATPHAAGAAALVKSRYPSYSPAQIRSFLETNAKDMGTTGKDTVYGYGRLYLPDPNPTSAVYHVEPGGSCGGNANCYTTITGAIAAAPSNAQIKVAGSSTPYSENVIINKSVTVDVGWLANFSGMNPTDAVILAGP